MIVNRLPKKAMYLALAGMLICTAAAAPLSGCAPAQDAVSPANAVSRTVCVSASDSVEAVPDKADVTMTVNATGKTSAEAQANAATDVDAVLEALGKEGIDPSCVSVAQVQIWARYDWSESVEKIAGYQASVNIEVRKVGVEEAGRALAAAADAADVTVGGVSYYVSDYDEQYQAALERALAAADKKALALAQAERLGLGPAVRIEEGTENQQYRMSSTEVQAASKADNDAAADEAAGAGGVALDPGSVSVQARITVEYELTLG